MSSKNEITFSIVVPIYNSATSIERCISSVLNQKESDWELILVDDGSNDDSVSICNKYKEKYHNKIRLLISSNNEGQLPSRMKGAKIAQGRYLLFLDSDDSYDEDAILLLKESVLKNNADLILFNPILFNNKGNKSIPQFSKRKMIVGSSDIIKEFLCETIYGYSCFFAIRRKIAISAFDSIKNYYHLRYTEDLAFMFNVFLMAESCYQTPYKIYNYYINDNSASTNTNIKKYYDRFVCFEYIYGENIDPKIVVPETKMYIIYTMLSFVRTSCFLTRANAKANLKIVRLSKLFKNYHSASDVKDRISKILIILLFFKMFSLLIMIVKRYYK